MTTALLRTRQARIECGHRAHEDGRTAHSWSVV